MPILFPPLKRVRIICTKPYIIPKPKAKHATLNIFFKFYFHCLSLACRLICPLPQSYAGHHEFPLGAFARIRLSIVRGAGQPMGRQAVRTHAHHGSTHVVKVTQPWSRVRVPPCPLVVHGESGVASAFDAEYAIPIIIFNSTLLTTVLCVKLQKLPSFVVLNLFSGVWNNSGSYL